MSGWSVTTLLSPTHSAICLFIVVLKPWRAHTHTHTRNLLIGKTPENKEEAEEPLERRETKTRPPLHVHSEHFAPHISVSAYVVSVHACIIVLHAQ